MGSKLKRSFRNSCNDDNSTSTLNQYNTSYQQEPSCAPSHVPSSSSYMENDYKASQNVPPRKSVTLEEMILQLELEEEKARREKAALYRHIDEDQDGVKLNVPRRMSCVNNSDVLRSARSALNQYPRFSLDGRDAMYRSSFRNNNNVGHAIDGLKLGRILHLPQSVGGESVIWCKPGVVPKLMGLEAMPLPISRLQCNKNKSKHSKQNLCNAIRSQNLRRRIEKNNEMERRQQRHVMDSKINYGNVKRSARGSSCGGGCSGRKSCSSSTGYSVMNPIAMESVFGLGGPVTLPTPYSYS